MSFPLDDQQRPAVEEHDRHLFLSAGAGSGKTRVLVERYLRVLEDGAWDPGLPGRILAITFTEKAAQQMRDRILERLVARGADAADPGERARIIVLAREMENAPISTIHGFCSRLLKEHAVEAGIDPRFRVPDEVSLHELRREILDGLLREQDPDLMLLAAEFGWSPLARALESLRDLRRSLALPNAELAGDGAERLCSRQRERLRALVAADIRGWQEGLPAALASLCSHLPDRQHPMPGGREKIAAALACLGSGDSERIGAAPMTELLARMKGLRTGGKGIEDEGQLKAKWTILKKEIEQYRDRASALVAAEDDPAQALAAACYRLLHRYAGGIAAESRHRGWLDFEDLQLGALDLLESDPGLAERCASHYRHVMIDELQDSNQVQHRLARCLVPEGSDPAERALFVVGDHRQSIYAFRNADVEVFQRESAKRAEAGELSRLEANYRSHPALVDYFNNFFPADEFPGMDKKREVPDAEEKGPRALLQITPQRQGGPGRVETRYLAAAGLARSLKKAWEEGLLISDGDAQRPLEWGDVAILVRSGAAITPLARALSEAGIPFEAAGGREYWLRQELLDLEDLVAALDDPYRRLTLARALRGDLIGVSTADLLTVLPPAEGGDARKRDGGELLARLAAGARGEIGMSEDGRERAANLLSMIDRFAGRLRRLPLRRLVSELVEASGFDLIAATRPRALKVLRNLRQLEELLAELEGGERLAVGEWLDYMARLREVAPRREEAWVPEEGGSLLRILTIHAAKGLEFPIVVVADIDRDLGRQSRPGDLPCLRMDLSEGNTLGASEALLGIRRRVDDEKLPDLAFLWIQDEQKKRDRAEAERLLYVAMTRAQDYLLVGGVLPLAAGLGARERMHGGEAGAEDSFLRRLSGALRDNLPPELYSLQIEGEDSFSIPGARARRPSARSEVDPPGSANWSVLVEAPARPGRLEIPVTSLALFESCPLRWQLERRLDADGLLPGESEPWSPTESSEEAGPGGRSFGTAVHRILEAWDFRAEPGEALAAACPADLSPAHRREAERLLLPLFGGDQPWVQRLRAGGRFRREEPFLLDLGEVLLSGQADLVFEWEGRDILIDWKSDRVEGRSRIDERRDQHQLQLALYALALREAGRPVDQALLCFLRPGQFRQVDQLPRQLEWAASKARKLAKLAGDSSRPLPGTGGVAAPPPTGHPPCSGCPFKGNFCPPEYRRAARVL